MVKYKLKNSLIDLLILGLFLSISGYADTVIIDDFDGIKVNCTEKVFGYGSHELSSETAKSGSLSLRISTSGVGWGCVILKEFEEIQDVSNHQSLTFWVNAQTMSPDTTAKIAVKLFFKNGSEWLQRPEYQTHVNSTFKQWTDVTSDIQPEKFQIEGFPDASDQDLFETRELTKIGIVLISVQQETTLFIDDLLFIGASPPEIPVATQLPLVEKKTVQEAIPLTKRPEFTGLIDDFTPPDQYNKDHLNDIRISGQNNGSLTDVDKSSAQYFSSNTIVSDGVLSLKWTKPNVKWITTLSDTGLDISSNKYLILRMKCSNTFSNISVIFSSINNEDTLTIPTKLIKTKYSTVNLPISSIDLKHLAAIRTIALVFHDESGDASLNQMGLSICKRPSLIKLNFPGGTLINSGNNVMLEVILLDEYDFPCSDFDSFIQLSVTNGFIYPNTITGFRNGRAQGVFNITGFGNQELIAKDIISGVTDN